MGTDELARWITFIKKYVIGKSKEVNPAREEPLKLPGLRKHRTRRR